MPHDIISADPSKKVRMVFRVERDGIISLNFDIDITNYVFDLEFRKRASDEPAFRFTESNGGIVHATPNKVNIVFTQTNSAVKPMEYLITFNRLKLSDGSYKAWLNGFAEATDRDVDNNISTDTFTIGDGGDTIQLTINDILAAGGTWGSITGTLSDQTDLQAALNLKADLASPTFTGTPAAPTASVGTNTTQLATTAFVHANTPYKATSTIFPTVNAHHIFQEVVGPSSNDKAIEIVNYGYTGHGASDDIHQNTTGLVRINGRLDLVRNMQWDQANAKWLTPLQGASAYGSACLELGGEAVILHATPSGVNFSDVPHEILLASANGTDGETDNVVTSGYFLQSKATIFARFNPTAYDPAVTDNCWNQTAGTDPLAWFSTQGTKNTENELVRLEGNGAGYGALFFRQSNGSLGSRAISLTGTVMGRIASTPYDGSAFQTTAAIDFVTRGTMSSGNTAQSIRFSTGASNTASLSTRLDITHEKFDWYTFPLRYHHSSISTIPDLSGFFTGGNAPNIDNSTTGSMQQVSTSTGGWRFIGMSTTSTAATAIAFLISGFLGATAPTAPAIVLQAAKHNGSTNVADLAATEIALQFRNNATVLFEMLGGGRTGFGVTTPTATIHLKAVTTSASSAPIKFNSGTVMTTAEAGAMEYNNTFHLTNSDNTRRHIVLAPNTTKITAGAPYTNDGYVVVNIGGTDFKMMTTA